MKDKSEEKEKRKCKKRGEKRNGKRREKRREEKRREREESVRNNGAMRALQPSWAADPSWSPSVNGTVDGRREEHEQAIEGGWAPMGTVLHATTSLSH